MFAIFAAAALSVAPGAATADTLVATAEDACVPVLTRTLRWPGSGQQPKEDQLLARLGLTRGVPREFYDKVKQIDPRLNSLSRAILASRESGDGAFAFVLGGVDPNCRLLVYKTADRAALAKGIGAKLAARGWKEVPAPATKTPKRVFVRRLQSGWIVMAQLAMPGAATPIGPMLLVDAFQPGTKVPPEFGI
ncbi:hypothetical protein [Sphingomonas sp.]|uniref:hypothetical protein n=1 Tax=Sphingomonas sp. TaxID=28214 RepID=UPI001B2C4BE8|nr:hypothetical protein [Sphingomonas sp.]MBO9715215.1 hypothetical protein [Sphingomonas sp.]